MTDKDIEEVARLNPAVWAEYSRIRLQKSFWTFEGRQYQVEPMTSTARRICVMKATQLGFTEIEVVKTLHGMIHGRYPGGVLYLFPTHKEVIDFSKARFGPLIKANPKTIGKYVSTDTDNAQLKNVNGSNLYLRGGNLTKNVGGQVGEMQSAAMRGLVIDKLSFDELDMMDEDVIDMAQGRLGDSLEEEEAYVSNPVLPDSGISAVFDKSDQRYWFRKCEHCGKDAPDKAALDWFMDKNNGWTCAELEFPGCVNFYKNPENKLGYVACKNCGKEILNEPGRWVPTKPDNSWYMHGYQLSQLSSAKRDPGEILNLYNDPPRKKDEIVRLRLGLPYVAAEERLTASEVFQCCGTYGQFGRHDGPCAMGIDCQKPKRIVIGARTGVDSYSIFRLMGYEDSNWNRIVDYVRAFNVKSVVIDIIPYEDSARQLQRKLRGMGVICYLCRYTDNSTIDRQYNNRTGVVTVYKTEVMDASHRVVTNPGQLTIPRKCPEVITFAKQMAGTAKVLEDKGGRQVYRYRKLGDDDYRSAFNYFMLACDSGKVAIARTDRRQERPTHALNDRGDSEGMMAYGRRRAAYAV